jgi:hypothetical protein
VTTVTTNSAGTDLVGMAVSFDLSTVYVADSLDCSIRSINVATGVVTFIVGSGCATTVRACHRAHTLGRQALDRIQDTEQCES